MNAAQAKQITEDRQEQFLGEAILAIEKKIKNFSKNGKNSIQIVSEISKLNQTQYLKLLKHFKDLGYKIRYDGRFGQYLEW